MRRWLQRLECWHRPRDTKDCRPPPDVGTGRRILPCSLRERRGSANTLIWISSLQDCDTIHFCSFKPPGYWCLVQAALDSQQNEGNLSDMKQKGRILGNKVCVRRLIVEIAFVTVHQSITSLLQMLQEIPQKVNIENESSNYRQFLIFLQISFQFLVYSHVYFQVENKLYTQFCNFIFPFICIVDTNTDVSILSPLPTSTHPSPASSLCPSLHYSVWLVNICPLTNPLTLFHPALHQHGP